MFFDKMSWLHMDLKYVSKKKRSFCIFVKRLKRFLCFFFQNILLTWLCCTKTESFAGVIKRNLFFLSVSYRERKRIFFFQFNLYFNLAKLRLCKRKYVLLIHERFFGFAAQARDNNFLRVLLRRMKSFFFNVCKSRYNKKRPFLV